MNRTPPLDVRYEVKFAYPTWYDQQVVAWVRAQALGFSTSYPPRRINNVYFDTLDLRAFDENIAGISQRCKMRYRWYGDALYPQRGTLEFKNKHAALGWKDNYELAEAPYTDGDRWSDVRRKMRRALPPEARLRFDEESAAALINRYSRRYFESMDRRIRITLDSDQEMYDQMRSSLPNVTRRINLPEVNILEMKCSADDRAIALEALADCPVRVSRFSKYTAGSELRD